METNEKIEVLITEKELSKRIDELASEISGRYKGKEIILIGVIKGALPFFVRLASKIKLPQKWDFMALSSYGDRKESSGVVKVNMDLAQPIKNSHILIIEDIIDSGLSMQYLLKMLKSRNPASIGICTLLLKEENLKADLDIDYVGFKIPNRFVVGFGLDHAQKLRELPYIGHIND